MRHSATPPSLPPVGSRRSPAAFLLRGGRLTKVNGEVASCAPSVGEAVSALLSSASLAGILSGAFLALTAQEARAACTETAGVWTCTGVITAAQSIKRSGSAISVNLDSGFDMDVAQGVGFTLEQSGAGGIAFVQAAGGQEIVGRTGVVHATNSGAGDISITATGKLGKTGGGAVLKAVNSDVSGGSVSVSVGSVGGSGAGGHAIEVANSGSGTTAVTASGSVSSGSGHGDGVNVETGKGSSSVTISVATVTGGRTGVNVNHRGQGSVSVSAAGTVRAGGGYGGSHALFVANRDSDSSITVAVATIAAHGAGAVDGIHVLQRHGGAVTVIASGSVSSAGRHGIFVDQRSQSGTPGQNARGDVKISVSGSVTGGGFGAAAIKVDSDTGDSARIVLESGAVVGRSGDVGIVESSGNAVIEVKAGAAVKGRVWLGAGADTLTVSDRAEVSGGVRLLGGNDILTVTNATVSGNVGLGYGNDTLTVSDGAKILGNVNLWNGDDTLTVSGGQISGTVDFGVGNDNFNFGPGLSEVIGEIRGAERFTFESGAVARITDTSGTDMSGLASLEIKSGAVAILDNAAYRHKVGSIRLKPGGILNIADGVAGQSGNNSPYINNVALLLGPDQEFNGTLIIDANFAESWADGLAWDGTGTRNWSGTMLIEPAVLAGGKGSSAIITGSLSASQIRAPEGFSIFFDPLWQQLAIRQDMENGTCTSAGSGAFTCKDLIHETQSLSATGEALDVTLSRNSVVHALAGTRSGLALSQSGADGITLTQSATGGRIAAAGHAIHARNAGAGNVSITVTGPVVGGLTGRVAEASGILVEGGKAGGGVHISAASVTGLRHGISASANGDVSTEATGSVTGRFGDGVKVETSQSGSSVAISVATVTGGQSGVRVDHRGAGSVSVGATGTVKASGGSGDDHAVSVTNHDLDSSITVAVATVTAQGTGAADGIHVRQMHGGTVTVIASGAVSSAGRHGIFVDQRSQDQDTQGGVTINVNGSVTGGDDAAAIKVDSDGGDNVRIVLERGAVVGRADEASIVESSGNAVVEVKYGAAVKGDVDLGDGTDALITDYFSEVSGDVDLGDGNDRLVVSYFVEVSGTVDLGDGSDALITNSFSEVSGDADLGDGNDRLAVGYRAEVSGNVDLGDGSDIMTALYFSEVSGDVDLGDGDDILTAYYFSDISGDVDLGDGDDRLIVSGGQISGTVDFGGGNDNFNFGPGASEVIGEIRGAERFTFESGAVVRINGTISADTSGLVSLEIKSGAVANLDNAGLNHEFDSIHLKPGGTLSIADGMAGSRGENGKFSSNTALRLGPSQEFNGTLIIDVDFAESRADGLAWNGTGSRNWRGTMLIEPAVLAEGQGGSAIITGSLSASQIRVPEGFSIIHDTKSGKTAIRQDMESGDCKSAGSGAFTCKNLIHETQSLSATGEALDVTLDRTSVVHALAGTHTGLALSQSGAGGITLTQSATGGRIAAAGHAIHARNAGAGNISIAVTGPVVGGLTGRVAEADGILVEGGAAGGGVHISAASVTGLRHGIFVETSRSATDRIGDGVEVETSRSGSSVAISVATVTGSQSGVRVDHRGAGSVSVRAAGTVEARGWWGWYKDSHAIFVTNHGLDSSITVAVATVTAQGRHAADGIHVRQPHRGAVTVIASGAVSSAGRYGIFVDQRSQSGHPAETVRGDVKISVSGSVTGGHGAAIRVYSDFGDGVRISLESGAVVGRTGQRGIVESYGNAVVEVKAGAAVMGGARLVGGDNTLTVSGATVSGGVYFGGDDDTLTVSDGGTVSGGVRSSWSGDKRVTVSDGATVSGGVSFFDGDDMLTVSSATVAGDVYFGAGEDTLTVSDGATVFGDVNFGDLWENDNDTMTVSNAIVSGDVDFGGGRNSFNFEPGFSEVFGKIAGAEQFTFESGAVARIAHTNTTDDASLEIKRGAIAILDNAGLKHNFSSIHLKPGGTLNIADGVAGSSSASGTFSDNISFRFGPSQEFNGTLIIDANFAESWADGLAWNGSGTRNWRGTMHIEPAVLAGGKGNSAAITGDLSASQLTAPEGFSIVHDPQSGKTAIRQDMASGTCTGAGGGAFACIDLIHDTQSLSATGEALSVILDRAGVVHALAGTRRGLSLSQSGTGGISLTQSSTGSRIAAAGHAIHARNAGAGDVSVTVTGLVVGGLTGRVADADGIAAESGAKGGDVRISAASVSGLRHGIAASAGGGDVSVSASGSVAGRLGDGVRAVALKGDVTVSVASAAGARAGIFGRGTGAVSISASGAAKSTGEEGAGIDGLASGSGTLSISAAEATGGSFGIRAVSKGSGSVSVTASGMIKATGGEGTAIYGLAAGGGSLTISAAGASGRVFGVKAIGSGSGSVSVSASGSVSSMDGASRHGILARASGAGGLTVSVDGAVRGGETGITAIGGEGGNVAVTASGRVAFGKIPMDGAAGIHAEARNGDLTVSATGEWLDRIVGYGDGIRAVSSGTGAVSVSAAMEVQTRNGDAIVVNRTKAGSVGISVSNLTMALRRPGTAGTAAAIRTEAPSDSSVTISLNSGAYLSMPGADAVAGGAGDAAVTVKSGATVQGRIALGSGTDTLVFDGGAFSGVERMDGGAGSDTLRFASGTGTLHATVRSEGLKGWERIVVESGAALRGGVRLAGDSGSLEFRGSAPSGALDGGSGTANTLSLVNVGTASVPASGLTGWETIAIGAGSEISFGSGAHTLTTQTLKVETGGTLNVGKDADTGDALTVSGDFAGGGTVTLNANFTPNAGASDRLTVTGDARGSTSVVFAKVGESGPVDDTARPMRIDGVISVAGAVGAGAFVLGSPIQFGMVSYSLAFDADSGEYDLLMTGAGGDAGALSHGAAAAAGALHFGPAATEALHSGPAAAAALHIGPAATAATLGAQAAAAGLAAASRAACREAPSGSGAFFCGGAKIGSPQRLGATGATALSVKLDTLTAVDTDGTAFSLTQSGTGGIAFERKEGGAAIRAKGDAIAARNAGGGSVSISARGAIAAGGDGVSAISDASGEGVLIDVATVAAGDDGVSVEAAAGGVSVTADDVKGRAAGIRVRTGDGGTGVEISAGSAEGGSDGISVDHGGGGEVRITATGAVSGARGDGVHARSGAGSISVRVSGEVSGGAAAGTAAIRTDGASAAVTLEDGASVRATGSGAAVMDGAGAALVTAREGASILGGVSLGAGADELVLAGGDFGGITSLDGGSGRDALRIEAGRGSLPALSNGAVSGFESVIVSGDAWIEGDLLLAEDAGELVFADGARIDGHGRLDGGGGASLSLRGVSGEMDAARLSGWTSLEIGEGSRVTLAGAGLGRDAAESLLVAGTMAFGSDARAGDAFTVEGDFEGGGRVEIDADLAAGSADRLVIEGDVSGTTEIALRDLTPRGAEPSGAEMTVVSVGGEADASAFRLAGGAVARGAFLYDLRMAPEGGGFALVADGGVSDTGAALQSASAAIARGLARATTLQARAAARAATSVWARVGSAATFAERGAALAGRGAVDLSARESRSVWMRFHGDRWDYGAGGAATIDSSGFEVGMDLLSRESSAGKWIAGLTAQYGTVGAEAAAGGGVGRQGASGYGVGATLSWLGYGGFYADAQAQAGISDSDFSSDTGGAIRSGVSARTALAALELGWRVAASDGATITPQAQISMSGVSGDRFVSGSLDVADRAATSLDGRVGLAAEIALREGYLRFSGSLLRALSEMDGTVVNGRTVEHGLPDGWAEFAVGGSLDLSEDRVIFLDGTWRTGLGGDGGDAGAASISGGLKVNW